MTESLFREVFFRHFSGIHLATTPFLPIGGAIRYRPDTLRKKIPDLCTSPVPLEVQFLGHDPEGFRSLWDSLQTLRPSTRINWNLGCPYERVTRKQRGAGLLPHPRLIQAFLKTLPEDCLPLFSIKLRAGLDHPSHSLDLLPLFNDTPFSHITLHPRLATDLYHGPLNIDLFRAFASHCQHPLIYNGDLFSRKEISGTCRAFPGLAGLMLGRGLLMRPDLAETEQAPHRTAERLRLFHREMVDVLGQSRRPLAALSLSKALWSYAHGAYEGGASFWISLRTQTCWDAYRSLLLNWLEQAQLQDPIQQPRETACPGLETPGTPGSHVYPMFPENTQTD